MRRVFVVLVVLALVLLIVGCGGSTATTTTTAAATTTTTQAPTTTTTALPTTTTLATLSPEALKALVVQVFTKSTPAMADEMVPTLKADSQTEAVRKFEYNPSANALVVDLGSVYQTASYIADYAWEVTQGVSAMYSSMMDTAPAVMEKVRPYLPGFQLTVNRKHFFSNAEMMIKIGHKEADELDWKAALNK